MTKNNERSWPGSDLPKFCVQTTVEIRKDPKFVKTLLFGLDSLLDCPLYHPEVESTEYKDPNKTEGVGAVRKCMFYKDAGDAEYAWQEIVHLDDEKIIMIIQPENRPPITSYIGSSWKVTAIDEDNARVEYSIQYALKAHPLTKILAKTVMKDKFSEICYRHAQAAKYYCETGNVATNTVEYPKPFDFIEFTNVYDLHQDSHSDDKLKDHMEGQTRFGTTASLEIMKPMDEVKSVLFDLSCCYKWHPFVESTEFKGGHAHNDAGTVRKCGFYKELKEKGIPEYVWEELVDVSHDQCKTIAFIQEENRPGIMDYIGKVFKLEEINENVTKLIITHTFRPKFLPLTKPMAAGPMKEHLAHETWLLCWCFKYYCETGETAKYDMVPAQIGFKEIVSPYEVYM